MHQVHTRIGNTVTATMLNFSGFSFIAAASGDKCAHLGLINTLPKIIHLPPMETVPG